MSCPALDVADQAVDAAGAARSFCHQAVQGSAASSQSRAAELLAHCRTSVQRLVHTTRKTQGPLLTAMRMAIDVEAGGQVFVERMPSEDAKDAAERFCVAHLALSARKRGQWTLLLHLMPRPGGSSIGDTAPSVSRCASHCCGCPTADHCRRHVMNGLQMAETIAHWQGRSLETLKRMAAQHAKGSVFVIRASSSNAATMERL